MLFKETLKNLQDQGIYTEYELYEQNTFNIELEEDVRVIQGVFNKLIVTPYAVIKELSNNKYFTVVFTEVLQCKDDVIINKYQNISLYSNIMTNHKPNESFLKAYSNFIKRHINILHKHLIFVQYNVAIQSTHYYEIPDIISEQLSNTTVTEELMYNCLTRNLVEDRDYPKAELYKKFNYTIFEELMENYDNAKNFYKESDVKNFIDLHLFFRNFKCYTLTDPEYSKIVINYEIFSHYYTLYDLNNNNHNEKDILFTSLLREILTLLFNEVTGNKVVMKTTDSIKSSTKNKDEYLTDLIKLIQSIPKNNNINTRIDNNNFVRITGFFRLHYYDLLQHCTNKNTYEKVRDFALKLDKINRYYLGLDEDNMDYNKTLFSNIFNNESKDFTDFLIFMIRYTHNKAYDRIETVTYYDTIARLLGISPELSKRIIKHFDDYCTIDKDKLTENTSTIIALFIYQMFKNKPNMDKEEVTQILEENMCAVLDAAYNNDLSYEQVENLTTHYDEFALIPSNLWIDLI